MAPQQPSPAPLQRVTLRPSASLDCSPSLSSAGGASVHPSQLHLDATTTALPEPSTSLLPSILRASSNPTTSDPPTQSRSDHPSLADEEDREGAEESEASPTPPSAAAARPPASQATSDAEAQARAGLAVAVSQSPMREEASAAVPGGARDGPPLLRSVSPPLPASVYSPTTSLASPSRATSPQRRTLPSSLSSALPRLPFFLRGGSGGAPTSPTRAAMTSAGSAGFLASLEPQPNSSPRSHLSTAQHLGPPTPSHRPLPLPSLRRSSQPPPESSGSRRATFLASVAFALGRLSLSQKTAAAAATTAAMTGGGDGGGVGDRAEGGGGPAQGGSPSSGDESPHVSGGALDRAPVGGLTVKVAAAVAEVGDEVTALSPHSLCSPIASASPMEAESADSSPLSPFQPGVLPGVYSHRPFQPFASSSPQPPLPLSSSSALSSGYLESWSESDDPLSPASFQQIVPSVYLGSAKSALNVDRLLQHRITHLLTVMNRPLNFQARADDAVDADQLSFGGSKQWQSLACRGAVRVPSSHPLFAAAMAGLSVNFVYLLDVPEADLLSALDDCLPYLWYAEQHQRGRVLIHCQAGISRSASVVIAYLVHRFGWTVREAWERCGEARPYINPNEGFVNQLDLFAKGEERKERQSRRRWREQAKRWWAASSRGKQMLTSDTATHLRPKPLPREARRTTDNEDSTQPGSARNATHAIPVV